MAISAIVSTTNRARSVATGVHSTTMAAFFAASSAPTPLYRLYQQEWSFSPLLLTVIFAVYALSLLAALLLFGSVSDKIGRRPVILAALILEVATIILFLAASDVVWLVAARLIQGFATGLATASLGAALIDIDKDRGAFINSTVPLTGMGVGALGSGLLVQFAPMPLHLVFGMLLVIFLAQLSLTTRVPETAEDLSSGKWSPVPRVVVPLAARSALLAVTPVNIAAWALGGFYLSLMPSLISVVISHAPSWMGGLAVAALAISGAIAVVVGRRYAPFVVLIAGAGALVIGLCVILAGANLASPALLLVGPIIAGIGFGGAFLGALRSVVPLAAPNQRAGLMAAFYIESCLANALPVVVAGYFVRKGGLLPTTNVFGSAIIIFAIIAVVMTTLRYARERRHRIAGLGSRAAK